MEDKKLPTIKLKGKDYVQVKDRILYFNENYENGMIRSEFNSTPSGLVFKAIVIPDITKAERFFVAHSMGTAQGDKAFEKLETVAIGRALALMGIGVLESVASADEIEKFHASTPQPPKTTAKSKNKAIENFVNNGDGKRKKGVNASGKSYDGIFYDDGRPPVWLTDADIDFLNDMTTGDTTPLDDLQF